RAREVDERDRVGRFVTAAANAGLAPERRQRSSHRGSGCAMQLAGSTRVRDRHSLLPRRIWHAQPAFKCDKSTAGDSFTRSITAYVCVSRMPGTFESTSPRKARYAAMSATRTFTR